MKINSAFGRKIRNCREENNLTIEQLAELCNMSDRCISDIELGKSDPKISTVLSICYNLNINLGELNSFYSREND